MEHLQKSEIARAILNCDKCSLNVRPVPGIGPKNAKLVAVAQNPGKNENKLGIPLIGWSGERFDEMLNFFGIERRSIGILNVVSCFMKNSTTPGFEEIRNCFPHRLSQIDFFSEKKVALALGAPAVEFLTGKKPERMRAVVGKAMYPLQDIGDDFAVIPLWHPAYFARKGSDQDKYWFETTARPKVKRMVTAILDGSWSLPKRPKQEFLWG